MPAFVLPNFFWVVLPVFPVFPTGFLNVTVIFFVALLAQFFFMLLAVSGRILPLLFTACFPDQAIAFHTFVVAVDIPWGTPRPRDFMPMLAQLAKVDFFRVVPELF